MGVSAVGKSTIAALVAARLGAEWIDADALHSPASIAKMSAGIALVDDDRWDWLDRVGDALAGAPAPPGIVVACSALRRVYRDRIRAIAPDAVFVHLTGTPELLLARAQARTGHFMPASLLLSQRATLEDLGADEPGFAVDVTPGVDDIVDSIVDGIRTHDG